MTADDGTGRDVPPKATLFCPECGHRSRVDGDWNAVETVRALHLVCPDCRTEVATRPSDAGSPRSRSRSIAPREAWRVGLRAWGRVWYRTVFPARTDE